MVEELPDFARKLLEVDKLSGRVRLVAQSASSIEAFSRIGAQFSQRTILVEDELAKSFVQRVARGRGMDFLNSIEVVCIPGGAETLAQRVVPVEAQLGSRCSLLLDGDQRPESALRIAADVPDSELEDELSKVKIPTAALLRDGGSGDAQVQLATARRRTLAWANNRIGYLPTNTNPDALLLEIAGEDVPDPRRAKVTWIERTKLSLGLLGNEHPTAGQILTTQLTALAAADDAHPHLVALYDELERLLANDG